MKGPLVSAPIIAGRSTSPSTVITIPDKLPGSLAAVDVKHKNAQGGPCAQQDKAMRPPAKASGGTQAAADARCHRQCAESDLHPGSVVSMQSLAVR
jgi:translocation and assembly module TamB